MKRVVVAVSFILSANIVILAQQAPNDKALGNKATKPQEQKASEPVRSLHLPLWTSQQKQLQTGSLDWSIFNSQLTKPENPFQIINGAVYIKLLDGLSTIPMSGGGASGCFDADLAERISKRKQHITLFPPRFR